MKIAIIQGGCFGDNVNSTLMLVPLKRKYQDSEIDVFTAERYASPFFNNPYINNIIKIDTDTKNESLNLAHSVKPEGYDIIINSHPLVNRNLVSNLHPELGENLILAWVNTLESMSIEYDYPINTEIYLSDYEIEESINFINKIDRRSGVVLMECEGESGQSFWNHNWTENVINILTSMNKTILISCVGYKGRIIELSKHNKNVIWVGSETIRTVSGIYDHCDSFISVSSGLSNACNVRQRSKKVKWVEVVNSPACSSNVIRSDGKIFWHENDLGSFINKLPSII